MFTSLKAQCHKLNSSASRRHSLGLVFCNDVLAEETRTIPGSKSLVSRRSTIILDLKAVIPINRPSAVMFTFSAIGAIKSALKETPLVIVSCPKRSLALTLITRTPSPVLIPCSLPLNCNSFLPASTSMVCNIALASLRTSTAANPSPRSAAVKDKSIVPSVFCSARKPVTCGALPSALIIPDWETP